MKERFAQKMLAKKSKILLYYVLFKVFFSSKNEQISHFGSFSLFSLLQRSTVAQDKGGVFLKLVPPIPLDSIMDFLWGTTIPIGRLPTNW